ncbi:hypothetical protein AAVH_12535 [Aphelenchoides avenae]|nr:hypothetical protein AAVH_12535 [Aphelenchus avenae]
MVRRSKGKLSKFLLRLQEDEEQTRQLLDRLDVFPADPVRGRRRHKTVIRDSQIRTMVVEYNALAAIDRTPEAKLELLRRIQFHLTSPLLLQELVHPAALICRKFMQDL